VLQVHLNESKADCLIHRIPQCHYKDRPKMAFDAISGVDIGKWPQEYLAHEYNKRLASSNSARSGGCHYAPACLHYTFPHACWMLDPNKYPRLDLLVDVADHFSRRHVGCWIQTSIHGLTC
jgi:hypothetical protein